MNIITPSLPLIDLHRHLDGNIRPNTIWQLANKHNIQLPSENFNDFLPHIQIQENAPDLVSFLKKLDWGVAVLKTLDDCKQIAFENVEDAYNAGLDYAELRFSPYYMSKTHNLPIADVVAAVIDGVQAGMRAFPISIQLIGILSRSFGFQRCQNEFNAILTHKNNIVALDLAGDEFNYPGEQFISLFKQARSADFRITVHAGEAVGASSVWQAINELGAERIGHGVRSIEDNNLLDYMVKYNIGVESCLTSNLQTGTVKNLKDHPIKTFLERGIKVCLNTDDPAVENIEIKHEFELAHSQLNLTAEDFQQLQKNALTMAFLSDNEKKALLNKCAV